ncbi:MAG: hypothetical protein IKH04_08660 [Kiritimatiellae bacterium]|nr:hypothetical protein [Kiritimatiellia bacterium]
MLTFHVIPNAHIDPVWLWDKAEGLNQAIRTFRSVLDLMDEFPFLTFMRGETVLYRHLEENDPATFKRVLERIREGRWEVVGGTFLQSDTNLPRFETLAKNFEIGLAYCEAHLSVRPRTAWAADSFGHCAGLPDIMAAAGMENFAFTRPFPATLPTAKPAFWWRGPSGARVLCYRPEVGWYGTRRPEMPRRLDDTLADAAKRDLDNVPVFIGVGDHGGGPSRQMVRQVVAWAKAHPGVRVEWSGLHRFFDALRAEAAAKGGDDFFPEITGELGYTLRGCYTTGARHKFAFRHAETELLAAERIAGLVAQAPGGGAARLDAAWRTLLFNTFHDILPGTCIERAAEEQLRELGAVRAAAKDATLAALNALALKADTSVTPPKGDYPAPLPFLLFNPHPWEFRGPVELEGCIDDNAFYFDPDGKRQAPLVVRDPAKRRVPFQIVRAEAEFGDVAWRSRVVVNARIPAQGFAVYTLGWDVGKCSQIPNVHKSSLSINDTNINANVANVQVLPIPVSNVANAGQDLKLNLDTGNIPTMATLPNASAALREICNGFFSVSARPGADGIRILRDGRPWLNGRGLQALLFRDPKGSWGDDDARQYDESTPPVTWKVEHAEVTESGPLRSALFVRLVGERSWLELTLRLAAGRDAIDCEARLLWNERGARLKLSVPCGAAAGDYAVPGAVVRRMADVGEVPGGAWVRAIDRRGVPSPGFASDALYGFDIAGGALRPSVVRATGFSCGLSTEAHTEPWRHQSDTGLLSFRFLLAPGDADMPRLATELEQPPAVVLAPNSEPGPLGRIASLAIGASSRPGPRPRKGARGATSC